MHFHRRKTRYIKVGSVNVGSIYPVSIQSMTNTDTADIESTVKQINDLDKAGCEIIRIAVPNDKSAEAIKEIKKYIQIPIIADIHFDYKLAVKSIKYGIDGVRINPGNIGSDDKVKAVAHMAGEYSVPIRIGANTGSLSVVYHPKNTSKNRDKTDLFADGLVNSALQQCELLEKYNFSNIKVSLKASDVVTTVKAYRKFAEITDYPLHLGVTEAGTLYQSSIKSSIGIGSLLLEGIGDTIRVSVTGEPIEEIKAARMILENTGHRKACPEIISCPTCGRTEGNLIELANKVEATVENIKNSGRKFKPSKLAVMGCAVNGPGEAKEAELGIAGAKKGLFIIFVRGKQIGAYKEIEAFEIFRRELDKLLY